MKSAGIEPVASLFASSSSDTEAAGACPAKHSYSRDSLHYHVVSKKTSVCELFFDVAFNLEKADQMSEYYFILQKSILWRDKSNNLLWDGGETRLITLIIM